MSNFKSERRALPDSWSWVNIGEIAEVIGGGTPSTIESGNFGGGIPWITPADMSAHVGKAIAQGARSISAKGLDGSGARWLPKGAVLFSSRAPIGYVAIASQPVTTNQGFKSFVPANGIDSDYLYYWLTSAKPLAEKLASGTTFLEISAAKAALIPFPIAPAAEQTRIVEKLEELLSDLDAGVAELKAAQKKLAQYRQSLLKAAVEGALTAEWRSARSLANEEAETGGQLLARILTERRSRWETRQLAKLQAQGKPPPKDWQANYPAPVAPDTKGLPELPQGWVWASIEQIAADERYSLSIGPFGSNLKVPDYREDGVPLVFVRNIRSGNYGGVHTKYVTPEKAEELRAHSIAAGDVLITKMGEPPGDADVYPDSEPPAVITADCIKVRCWSGLMLPHFLKSVINSYVGQRQIQPMTQGVAQKKVSLGRFSNLAVPVPSSAEQVEIMKMVAAANIDALILEIAIAHGLKQSAAQRKNILQAAFSGQLVPQDPADEPASALLARIRAERATRGTGFARGRGKQTVAKQTMSHLA